MKLLRKQNAWTGMSVHSKSMKAIEAASIEKIQVLSVEKAVRASAEKAAARIAFQSWRFECGVEDTFVVSSRQTVKSVAAPIIAVKKIAAKKATVKRPVVKAVKAAHVMLVTSQKLSSAMKVVEGKLFGNVVVAKTFLAAAKEAGVTMMSCLQFEAKMITWCKQNFLFIEARIWVSKNMKKNGGLR